MALQFVDLKAQYLGIQGEIDSAVARVMASGWYILGQEGDAFEHEYATWLGVRHALGVGSGTEALHLALLACGVGPGDEVATVSHTAVATVSAITLTGARPVFVDIDPQTFTMNPQHLAQMMTRRTKAVIPVHIYGQTADMSEIMRIAQQYQAYVIEDCAQCHGATLLGRKAGTFGDLACWSFYPTKNLGANGDGGAVTTNDDTLAERVRLLRQYGWKERYISSVKGLNSRLDEVQAAILRVKLTHLEGWNERRRAIATVYDELLPGTGLQTPPVGANRSHVYHLYVVRTRQRDALKAYLTRQGVPTAIHYPLPVHQQPAYADVGLYSGQLAETEQAAAEILSLPLYPEMPVEHAEQVAEAIRKYKG